jgi:hypothetical protein
VSHLSQTIINAAAFVPMAADLSSLHAAQCLAHIERRGYRLFSVLRTWAQVVEALHAGAVEVVVFARRDHLDPEWTPRFEYVGDETRDLLAGERAKPRNNSPGAASRQRRAQLTW